MSRPMSLIARFFLFILICSFASLGAAGDGSMDGVWTRVGSAELQLRNEPGLTPWIQPQRYKAVRLSAVPLAGILDQAPVELSGDAERRQVVLTLPTPDGRFEAFEIVVSSVMEPELETWMADQGWPMRTYRGVSLDNPATSVRLDWGGPAGFHASVLSPRASYYVDPYWKGNTVLYTSYFRSEYLREDHDFRCFFESSAKALGREKSGSSTTGNLRSYRLVVAATGEYTAFHGGTKPAGQAAIVTTVNRVNQVYENDLSIRMVLVGNNSDVVFTDAGTDPYTNGDGVAMLSQNQAECDATIGDANYDIGHVVSTGGGGIASLGVPCRAGVKARGVTGTSNPVGDPFDIDFVAHEMGHQWGGYHTFNSVTSNCGGGNRNSSTAYEPGSGSTIQAYAGICGADNLQPNSDPYFHGISLDEMLNYSAGLGACSSNAPGSNPNAPTVDAGAAFTIPVSTAFELSVASSNDLDGDAMTYTWEEFDLGAPTALTDGDNGSSPIFRTWPPATSISQLFPNDGVTPAAGETLPTTDRTMTFRLTVRDNNPGGGRVGEDTTTVTSTTSAGPFLVTTPNGGESWDGTETVTWDVAGTAGGAVSTANVDILLSIDGGATWPTTLLSGTPNDGSQSVTLPDVDTNAARIKIMASANIFFDTSDGNFAIGTVVNQTLHDQSTLCSGNASTSQYFPDFTAGTDLADDFTVPPGERWTLGAVSAPGVFTASADPLQSANVFVWSNSGGLPGAVVSGCSFLSLAPVGGLSDPNIAVNLPGTCVLDPGTYWIEMQAVLPFGATSSQWFWTHNTGTFGAEFAYRDVVDLLSTGCTVWTTQGTCLGAPESELCFTISGSNGVGDVIFEDGFESGNLSAWSSSVP
jgi:hypothetical protein